MPLSSLSACRQHTSTNRHSRVQQAVPAVAVLQAQWVGFIENTRTQEVFLTLFIKGGSSCVTIKSANQPILKVVP